MLVYIFQTYPVCTVCCMLCTGVKQSQVWLRSTPVWRVG